MKNVIREVTAASRAAVLIGIVIVAAVVASIAYVYWPRAPEAGAVIGPEGGVVEVTTPQSPLYGLMLDIPAGAVQEETTISVKELPKSRVDSILSARKFASARKHVLGGFVGEPDGLVFDVPVMASVPVDPLNTSGGIPVQAKVLLDEETYWLEPTDLVYDPDEGMVDMMIRDFSGHAVVELEELLKQPEEECREGWIHVESFFVGFAGGDGCQVVADTVSVTFLSCPGKPTEDASVYTTTPECGPDFSLTIQVDPPSATLFPDTTVTLKAQVRDQNGKEVNVPIYWRGGAGVAEVNLMTGVVRGLREGETVIRAVTPDPRYYGECIITVIGWVYSVEVTPSPKTIFVGETLPLTAIPRDVDGERVEGFTPGWRSNDTSVATVNSNGVVTGEGPGKAKIMAWVEDVGRNVWGSASITVKAAGRVVIEPKEATIFVGETQHLEVTVYDTEGNELPDYPVDWMIPPGEKIAFNAVTQTVRGVSPGTAEITATCNGKSASATITVVVVASVEIHPAAATILLNETLTLTVTVYDKDGNELQGYPIEWTIPPGGIISFDPVNQIVRGVSPGTAEITATVEGKSASATITVVSGKRYRLTWEVTVYESFSRSWEQYIGYWLTGNESFQVDVQWVGSAEVEISDHNQTVLSFSTEGYYHDFRNTVITYHCSGEIGDRTYIVTEDRKWTIADAAAEYIKERLYIRVRERPDGSLYIENPFSFLFTEIPEGCWRIITLTSLGYSGCYIGEPHNHTNTDQRESGFPSLNSPGDLEADDATGQSFSTKTQVEYHTWYGFPLYAHWDVSVTVIDEEAAASSFSAASLMESQVAYTSPYTNIDVSTAHNMITGSGYPDILVLDVRTQSEYDSGHIPGAFWIPVTELEARISELAVHENHEIILYCRSGVRSATASEILHSHGFTKVYNMLGGISAWQSAGYPLNPERVPPSPPLWTQWWFWATVAAGIIVLIGAVHLLNKRKPPTPTAPTPPTEGIETSIE